MIDVALWDLLGKDTGLPVHTLMGGARRTTIPLYWSTGSGWRMQPEEMLALVRAGHEQGFRSFKIRMDWRGWRQDVDPEKDFRIFRLVREFLDGGEYLGFDAPCRQGKPGDAYDASLNLNSVTPSACSRVES